MSPELPEPQFGRLDESQPLAPQIAALYEELRCLAHNCLRSERAGHTLNTTALVHEAYLRLRTQRQMDWHNRAYFFGTAAKVMRRVLTDYARSRTAAKRVPDGSGLPSFTPNGCSEWELVAIDRALRRLELCDPRQARIVELRFFAGCSVAETAEILSLSTGTVKNDWAMAKAWLRREICGSTVA